MFSSDNRPSPQIGQIVPGPGLLARRRAIAHHSKGQGGVMREAVEQYLRAMGGWHLSDG